LYGPTIFDPFRPFLSGASGESWAQDGCRPKSHSRQRYIRDVSDDTCTKSHPRQLYIRDVADNTCAKSHPRQLYIRDVADDTCAWKGLALWVMHRQRGEVNGMHVCKNGNLMRQEASE
jgi:hypothetical protein